MDRDRGKAEADLAMEDLRNQLDDQSSASRDENAHQRDELLELRPLTFMGEIALPRAKIPLGPGFQSGYGRRSLL